jgi:hypothetical protein
MPMTYLLYRPEIERPDADEQETIDGIIRGMTQQSETVERREQHAVRASHAKSSALVTGRPAARAGARAVRDAGLAPGRDPFRAGAG